MKPLTHYIITLGITIGLSVSYYNLVERHSLLLDEASAAMELSGELINSQQAQLDRDDRIISQLLAGWDRAAPVFSRQVDVTAYTSRPEETDSDPYITACNTPVTVGGIAVSRDLFVELGGCGKPLALGRYGGFFINDKMNARFTDTVDIWSGDLGAANLHGPQTAIMMWQ